MDKLDDKIASICGEAIMKISDRTFNLITNLSLLIALAASLAPQFVKAAQPFSGYVALAAGVTAVCVYFASEFWTGETGLERIKEAQSKVAPREVTIFQNEADPSVKKEE